MMAVDRSPSLPNLEPKTVEALRAALTHAVSRGTHADDLGELVCTAAREARAKGIQAERLLVILKDIWYALPAVAAAPSAGAASAMLQGLISRCIQEYYAA